jgi:short-subunit dehydrogenase
MSSGFAIVTGASTGIGFELAHRAAENGYDLLVVADEPLIEASAQDFQRHGTSVQSIEADLSTIDGVDKLLAATAGRTVDLLFANAGIGTGGPFLDQDVAMWRRSVDTNITGTVYLLQKVVKQMVSRGEGRVLVTGSIAGYIPGAFNAVYNATKAFVDNFTEALRNEIKEHEGVTITTLMPGPVETEFFARAGLLDTQVGQDDSKSDPAKVAADGWNALMAGKGHIVSGVSNKLQVAASGVLPQSFLAEQHRKMAEPGSAES